MDSFKKGMSKKKVLGLKIKDSDNVGVSILQKENFAMNIKLLMSIRSTFPYFFVSIQL